MNLIYGCSILQTIRIQLIYVYMIHRFRLLGKIVFENDLRVNSQAAWSVLIVRCLFPACAYSLLATNYRYFKNA